jgi:cytochrome d ubiquinol oxidase subunit I
MDHVIAARAQMGTSLAFHIVFAALGVGLPLLVFIAEGLWLRTKDRAYYDLARSWAKGMGILFAVGAVSGTILSFELGLLWPAFMRYAGGIIGLPFSLEGFAFFIEAIFIGIYLYGWDKLSPRTHWLSLVPVAVSGAVSAGFVILANAWMQMPVGFRIVDGRIVDVQPFVAMFAPPWLVEVTHGTIGAYVFTAFAVAAVCAAAWLRGEQRRTALPGLRIAMVVGAIAIPTQILMGDVIARFDADREPAKFAAMEVVRHTTRGAPLTIGGIPTRDGLRYTIEIPELLSVLVGFDPNAKVRGLDAVPPANRPPVAATHLSFDAMVASGTFVLVVAFAWAFTALTRRGLSRPLAVAIWLTGPAALVALEAGWFVTEFGRQPWIAVGLQRTSDAVTLAPNLDLAFYGFSFIYVVLGVTCAWLLRRVGRTRADEAHPPSAEGQAAA